MKGVDDTTTAAPTRRRLLLAGVGLGTGLLLPRFARARRKHTLRIQQWNHFVPAYDDWFDNTFVRQWGEANDTEVIVDRVGLSSLNSRAQAEVDAGRGHDLFMSLHPPTRFEDQVIDHGEIYQECRSRYGEPLDIAIKSSLNPKTGKYFCFAESYVANLVNYRRDLWRAVGMQPDSWDEIRRGGAEIRQRFGIPVGIGMSRELDSSMTLRALLYSFGASVQTMAGRPNLASPQTLEAIRYATALYREAMDDEVLSWDASSNNRMMLAGRGSLCINAISIPRIAESQQIGIGQRLALAKIPSGPVQRIGPANLMHLSSIWKFAANIEGAKQFLVDYIGAFRDAFLASQFYNLPCFPASVPDLDALLANDPQHTHSDKYRILQDANTWNSALGWPGFANAAIDEVYNKWVISDMFASAARGQVSAEEAMNDAARRVGDIFDKWRAAGKI